MEERKGEEGSVQRKLSLNERNFWQSKRIGETTPTPTPTPRGGRNASNFQSFKIFLWGKGCIFEAGGKKNYLIFCSSPHTLWPTYVKRKQQSSSRIYFLKNEKFSTTA